MSFITVEMIRKALQDRDDFIKQLEAENNTLKNNIGEYTAIMLENAELKAENERLKQEVSRLNQEIVHEISLNSCVANSNKRLTEVLKRCSPYDFSENDHIGENCKFCGDVFGNAHKDDCLYVRLCGGVKDETR